ncbi:MAG: hypothetical protein P0Y56_11385 [Candidatus Andeanibacterium colombiense]|uniref:DUF3617 family protein n=1 Tax=Candidatus Andeanibacterium colombiense TaxID=3121345 RepID=A0AAJ5X4T6_9SPHN|nr:MAG: hypothetical protein P0Y56_11385 [Sphingomonadaceae bacterium]
MLNAAFRPFLGIAGIVSAMLVAPVAAQGPELAMLDGLHSGAWDIKLRGQDTKSRLCIRSGRDFIQLRHKQQSCERFIVDDNASLVTVHYSCPHNGFGQTTIRKESSSLLQISTQGVEGKQPFNFDAEARYVGSC